MDIMEWATYFSLETIYDITFGERAGFVEEGRDGGYFLSHFFLF
jgi:hypothetical protein